jgi:predicted metal-dependent hydrolase
VLEHLSSNSDLDMDTIISGVWGAIHNATSSYPIVQIKSSVDGRTYNVRDLPDKQKAADLLAKVRRKLQKLIDSLRQQFPHKPQVIQLNEKFEADPRRFYEATPDSEHVSYSVNKGDSIHLCLRQRNKKEETLVEENVMVFVALHEMGHVITSPSVKSHGPEFWNNFGWLLREAEALEIYKYQDFKAHPVTYCGEKITDQPKYDPSKDLDIEVGNPLKIGNIR